MDLEGVLGLPAWCQICHLAVENHVRRDHRIGVDSRTLFRLLEDQHHIHRTLNALKAELAAG